MELIETELTQHETPHWWQSQQPQWFQRALGVPVQTGCIDVEGGQMVWRRWGDTRAPALILMHGFLGHGHWWDFIAPFFADDWQLVAPDFTGMGESSHTGLYQPPVHAQHILALADALGLDERTRLVGHSYGGFVAFIAAHAHPERFRQLLMIDAPIRADDEGVGPRSQSFKTGGQRVYKNRDYALSRFRIVPQQSCQHPYLLAHIAEHSLRKRQHGWTWKFDPAMLSLPLVNGLMTDFSEFAGEIDFIRASNSAVCTPEQFVRMKQLKGEKFFGFEVPEAEHHMFLNQPMAFITAVRAALARVSR